MTDSAYDLVDAAESKEQPKVTTGDMERLLWDRYANNGEHVVLFDVPDDVGTGARRRCDAVAVGMWKSSGRLIHGFEIKASRSDWLRELKDVTKADPFIARCDLWTLVTADASIAKIEEIPAIWGWMTATKNGLRVQRPPTRIPQESTDLRRLWALALIRASFDRGSPDSKAAQLAFQKERDMLAVQHQREIERAKYGANDDYARLKAQVDEFEKNSGMKLGDWRLGNVGKLAAKLQAIDGDYKGYKNTLEEHARRMRMHVEDVEEVIRELGGMTT